MPAIAPNLWFDTCTLEAAEFYVSVFPNSRIVDVLRHSAWGGEREGTVVTVDFELDGTRFTGINGGPEFTFDEAGSFFMACTDQAEVDRCGDALLAGGGKPSRCGRDLDPARAERTAAADGAGVP